MLRIKESRWENFCANAHDLGYEVDGKKYVEIGTHEKQIRIDTKTIRIKIFSKNKPYVSTDDKIFDLIVQGYVEKELAEEGKE